MVFNTLMTNVEKCWIMTFLGPALPVMVATTTFRGSPGVVPGYHYHHHHYHHHQHHLCRGSQVCTPARKSHESAENRLTLGLRLGVGLRDPSRGLRCGVTPPQKCGLASGRWLSGGFTVSNPANRYLKSNRYSTILNR